MIPVGQRVSKYNVKSKSHVWARREPGGEWEPAQVTMMMRNKLRVVFESNGRGGDRHYDDLALRNVKKAGKDKPAP